MLRSELRGELRGGCISQRNDDDSKQAKCTRYRDGDVNERTSDVPLYILYTGPKIARHIDTWERTAADRFVVALSLDKVGRLDARNRGLLILTVEALALAEAAAAATLLSTVSTLCVSAARRATACVNELPAIFPR